MGFGDQAETPSSLKAVTSAIKPITRKYSRFQWEMTWDKDRHGRTSHRLAQIPHKDNLNKYRGLTKAESAILLQARTGKIGLRRYLHRIGATNSPKCECDGIENVQHVLLQCPNGRGTGISILDRSETYASC